MDEQIKAESGAGMIKAPHGKTIEKILQTEGKLLSVTQGVSMRPMLKSGRDVIVVVPKSGRLKPLDVALYKRGDAYVLHRVISVTESGYIIRGDNTYVDEIVAEESVIGVLTEYFSKGRSISVEDEKYKKYSKNVVKNYKRRKARVTFVVKVKRAIKKMIGKK